MTESLHRDIRDESELSRLALQRDNRVPVLTGIDSHIRDAKIVGLKLAKAVLKYVKKYEAPVSSKLWRLQNERGLQKAHVALVHVNQPDNTEV